MVEGVTFHLYGISLSGAPVDEYAVTDRTGRAYFRNVLIGTGYTLEEMDVAVRYVVPGSQSAAVEWNTVTRKTFENRLKKWNATVTKRDGETGSALGDGSLAGAVYGVYQGGKLVDTYTTDAAQAAQVVNAIRPLAAVPTHYAAIVGSAADGRRFMEGLDTGIACRERMLRTGR